MECVAEKNGCLTIKLQNKMKETRSHIINLYMIALSDSDFAIEEMNTILKIAAERGFSKEEFEKTISNPVGVEFHIPENFVEKIKFLYDFVRIILADGIVKNEEIDMFMNFCKKFNFDTNDATEILEWLKELASKNLPKNLIEDEIQQLLEN